MRILPEVCMPETQEVLNIFQYPCSELFFWYLLGFQCDFSAENANVVHFAYFFLLKRNSEQQIIDTE